MNITGLHHVALRVKSLDASLALYRDLLGLKPAAGFVIRDQRFVLLDCGNGGHLELVEGQPPQRGSEDGDVLWHLCLGVQGLDEVLSRVEAAGFEVTMQPLDVDLENTVGDGMLHIRIGFFRGPDGELVELFEGR